MFLLEFIALIFILYIVYESSNSLKYYLKFLVYYGGVILNSFLLLPYLLLRPTNPLNLLTASKFCSCISRLINLTWTLRGADNLSKDYTVVIVANHQSSLDILGMFDIWPVMQKTTVVAKRELLYAWPFGVCAWLCGLIFIDRYHAEKAKQTLDKSMEGLKKNNVKLWVFPEGTRRNTGQLHEFKKGAFHVAITHQVPILPVVFSSYQPFLDDEQKILNPGEVIIEALPEIPTKGLTSDDVVQLMSHTKTLMESKFRENTNEIQSKQTISLNYQQLETT